MNRKPEATVYVVIFTKRKKKKEMKIIEEQKSGLRNGGKGVGRGACYDRGL